MTKKQEAVKKAEETRKAIETANVEAMAKLAAEYASGGNVIRLQTQRDDAPAALYVRTYGRPGDLAVHKSIDGKRYTVTQVRSGMRVLDMRTLAGARKARAALLAAPGWDLDILLNDEARKRLGVLVIQVKAIYAGK
jgi:hypothetical protein